jgi:hypothetical protein
VYVTRETPDGKKVEVKVAKVCHWLLTAYLSATWYDNTIFLGVPWSDWQAEQRLQICLVGSPVSLLKACQCLFVCE